MLDDLYVLVTLLCNNKCLRTPLSVQSESLDKFD